MSDRVPESREVWEHGEREFDRRDAQLGRYVLGVLVAVVVLVVAAVFG